MRVNNRKKNRMLRCFIYEKKNELCCGELSKRRTLSEFKKNQISSTKVLKMNLVTAKKKTKTNKKSLI